MLHNRTGRHRGTMVICTSTVRGEVDVQVPHRQTWIYTQIRRAGYRTIPRKVAMAMGPAYTQAIHL